MILPCLGHVIHSYLAAHHGEAVEMITLPDIKLHGGDAEYRLRASSLLHDEMRKRWYHASGVERDPIRGRSPMTFLIGNVLEAVSYELIKRACKWINGMAAGAPVIKVTSGLNVTLPELVICGDKRVTGMLDWTMSFLQPDGSTAHAVIDHKAVNKNSFDELERGVMNIDQYVAQVGAYMDMASFRFKSRIFTCAALFVLCKDTGAYQTLCFKRESNELVFFQHTSTRKPGELITGYAGYGMDFQSVSGHIADRESELQKFVESGDPPPRCYTDPESWQCRYCRWQTACWAGHCDNGDKVVTFDTTTGDEPPHVVALRDALEEKRLARLAMEKEEKAAKMALADAMKEQGVCSVEVVTEKQETKHTRTAAWKTMPDGTTAPVATIKATRKKRSQQ